MKTILFVVGTLLSGCLVSGSGRLRVRGAVVVQPAPPSPQMEEFGARPGHVWITGRWQWNGNRYVWKAGHWERERAGRAWQAGAWQQQNGQWVWIDGRWIAAQPAPPNHGGPIVRDHRNPQPAPPPHSGPIVRDHRNHGTAQPTPPPRDPAYPWQAPPPPQAETSGTRAGFVWIAGRWNWQGQQWQWVPGHWERARANSAWTPGRWELGSQGYYVWVEGKWGAPAAPQPGGVIVRDHRN